MNIPDSRFIVTADERDDPFIVYSDLYAPRLFFFRALLEKNKIAFARLVPHEGMHM